MTKTEFFTLKYLSKVFMGLSTEKKDCVLNTARTLIKIQDDNNFPIINKANYSKGVPRTEGKHHLGPETLPEHRN